MVLDSRYCVASLIVAFFTVVNASPTNYNTEEVSQLTEYLGLTRNSYRDYTSARGDASIEDKVEEYIKSHDAKFDLPFIGSSVTLGTSNLAEDELDIQLKFSDSSEMQARKKSKIKKILVPILIFILLKAMTLVPLALGVLGIKAWNALQLSFLSFVVSLALAVFQLCKKLADHPPVIAHSGWEPHMKRSFDNSAQELAYNAYLN